MNIRQARFCLLAAAAALTVMADSACAFCPMCKTAVEGAGGAPELAGSLTLAALVLLAPPVMIFAALFGFFYRLRHASGQPASSPASSDDADAAHGALTD